MEMWVFQVILRSDYSLQRVWSWLDLNPSVLVPSPVSIRPGLAHDLVSFEVVLTTTLLFTDVSTHVILLYSVTWFFQNSKKQMWICIRHKNQQFTRWTSLCDGFWSCHKSHMPGTHMWRSFVTDISDKCRLFQDERGASCHFPLHISQFTFQPARRRESQPEVQVR